MNYEIEIDYAANSALHLLFGFPTYHSSPPLQHLSICFWNSLSLSNELIVTHKTYTIYYIELENSLRERHELPRSRSGSSHEFQARPVPGRHASRCFRDISDQHVSLHVSETRQYPRDPQGHARPPRQAVSSHSPSIFLFLGVFVFHFVKITELFGFLGISKHFGQLVFFFSTADLNYALNLA